MILKRPRPRNLIPHQQRMNLHLIHPIPRSLPIANIPSHGYVQQQSPPFKSPRTGWLLALHDSLSVHEE